MSEAVLSRLVACEEAMIRALDTGGCADLDAAATDLARETVALRAAGAWHATPALRLGLIRALALLDAARVRINYLADRTNRRLDLLAMSGAVSRAPARAHAYRRTGRLG